jgi:hypothetical protein
VRRCAKTERISDMPSLNASLVSGIYGVWVSEGRGGEMTATNRGIIARCAFIVRNDCGVLRNVSWGARRAERTYDVKKDLHRRNTVKPPKCVLVRKRKPGTAVGRWARWRGWAFGRRMVGGREEEVPLHAALAGF